MSGEKIVDLTGDSAGHCGLRWFWCQWMSSL
jgi:hypothetical protein